MATTQIVREGRGHKWLPERSPGFAPVTRIPYSLPQSTSCTYVAGHRMFSVRLCATTAVLLLTLANKCGGNGPLPDDSWFDDEKVYTFSYNSRSMLGHSNITTDAQVCDHERDSVLTK